LPKQEANLQAAFNNPIARVPIEAKEVLFSKKTQFFFKKVTSSTNLKISMYIGFTPNEDFN
jgi:hypothetical protein